MVYGEIKMSTQIQPESELIINELKIILSDIQYRINNLINHIHSSLDVKPSNSVEIHTPDNGTKPEDTTHPKIKDLIDKDYSKCNCGGIYDKTWTHESWCSSQSGSEMK